MSLNAGGKDRGVSANEYSCTHGAQVNLGAVTPYLTSMAGGVCGAVPDAGSDLPPGRGGHPPPSSAGHFKHFISGVRIRIDWTFLQ
jgi:hypothetical protein